MFSNEEIKKIALEQSAIDCNCAPEDFLAEENRFVVSEKREGARKYLKHLPFSLDFVCYGNNVLVSGKEKYFGIAKRSLSRVRNGERYRIFLESDFHALDSALRRRGLGVRFVAEYWLPDVTRVAESACPYELEILQKGEFDAYYGEPWHNALCKIRKEDDRLAVGAFDGAKLVGLAGASADCDTMWQIGVDVLPEYRRKGIAAAAVSKLAVEILRAGIVPFYCCAWSNLGSANTAASAGFRPAWVEMTAAPLFKP